MEIAFGPVPSRRLGRSLGINNIPPKHCSYSCVYCQVGATPEREVRPRAFHPPDRIFDEVARRLDAVRARGETVDYLTFVPDGEPTLDSRLARSIAALRRLNLPIAVISNASLIWQPGVRDALGMADWVSVKVDTVDENLWRQINQPHPDLRLAEILDGIRDFACTFKGTLVSETMLLAGINDDPEAIAEVGLFLAAAGIRHPYLAVPIRPPAEPIARIPDETTVDRACRILAERGLAPEPLSANEGDAFAFSGDLQKDVLAIAAVHPLRESALRALVAKSGAGREAIDELLSSGQLKAVSHAGDVFYVRRPRTET